MLLPNASTFIFKTKKKEPGQHNSYEGGSGTRRLVAIREKNGLSELIDEQENSCQSPAKIQFLVCG